MGLSATPHEKDESEKECDVLKYNA